jgi:hypothetical protein
VTLNGELLRDMKLLYEDRLRFLTPLFARVNKRARIRRRRAFSLLFLSLK